MIEFWSPEKQVSEWIGATNKSLREIEATTGVSRSKLSKFKEGKGSLTVSDLASISSFLQKNPRDIFGRDTSLAAVGGAYTKIGTKIGDALMDTVENRTKDIGKGLSVEDVIFWHESTEGHLYRCDEIRAHLMAVEPVSDTQQPLKIISVGEKSLAWQKIQSEIVTDVQPENVEEFVASSIADRAREMLLIGYVDVQKTNSRQYLDRKLFHMQANGKVLFTTYFTVLMAGFWHDGKKVIWNFSKEIKSRLATEAELEEIQGYLDHQ